MWGSQLLQVISHAQWEDTNTHWDTITHINEQNKYVRGYSPISVGKVSLFVPFPSSVKCAQTLQKHSLDSRLSFSLCISTPFQARLIPIFMSLA